MPKRIPIDSKIVLEALKRNQGRLDITAAELNIHVNTVRKYRNRALGLCYCGDPLDDPKKRYCAKCRERAYANDRLKSQRKRSLGICRSCNAPLGNKPNSIVYCDSCLAKHNLRCKKYKGRLGYVGRWEVHVRSLYGEGALVAYAKSGGICQACRAGEPAYRHLDLHHLDSNLTNGAESNFAILCRTCHATLTRLLEHPNRDKLLAFLPR